MKCLQGNDLNIYFSPIYAARKSQVRTYVLYARENHAKTGGAPLQVIIHALRTNRLLLKACEGHSLLCPLSLVSVFAYMVALKDCLYYVRCLLGGVYVPCINRVPGGVIVGDLGLCCCVPVQYVTSINVRVQLLPIVC